jgi:hypothetical protein
MVKNIVAGLVVAALIFMLVLAYAQATMSVGGGHLLVKGHHGLIKAFKPCGSVSPQM